MENIDEKKFAITIVDSGERYLCGSTQSLLKAMLSVGREGIPSGCHGGGCGVCKIQIVSGQIHTEPMSRAHVTEQEQKKGMALACRSYPLSDVELKAVGGLRKNMVRSNTGYVLGRPLG